MCYLLRLFSGVILGLAILACAGCRSKPPAPPPRSVVKSIKPPSIFVDPSTGWMAAPTDGGMPLYTNVDYVIEYFPPLMRGSIVIQRRGGPNGDLGYLNGKVSVPSKATLYVALRDYINNEPVITSRQFDAFSREGWVRVPGLFGTTEPRWDHWHWQVWAHEIDAGPVVITSKAIPEGGVFFLGRPRDVQAFTEIPADGRPGTPGTP